MNKEELEKIIIEEFSSREYRDIIGAEGIKQFIFDTIIPEVLKSMLKENDKFNQTYVNNYNRGLKKKAKELYGIDL